MPMQDSDYADLVNLTRRKQVEFKMQDLAGALRDYESKRMLKEEADSFESGADGWEWRVMTNYAGSARMVGTRTPDVYNQANGTNKLTFPWRQMNDNWIVNKIDLDKNQSPSAIFKLVKAVRAMQQGSTATLVEDQMWSKPTDSNDILSFWGIPQHVIKTTTGATNCYPTGSATGGSEGFNTANPAGFSDYGGLSRATYRRLCNYAGLYTNVTKPDLIDVLRRGGVQTKWKSPVDLDSVASIQDKYRLYTATNVWLGMCRLAENQNDNLGGELGNYVGGAYKMTGPQLTLFGNPVIPVAKLDSDTSNPIYGLNWSTLMIKFLAGWMMREGEAHIVPFNHLEIATDVDTVFNMGCVDPSTQMVISNGL